MKKVLIYIVLAVALIGMLMNLDLLFNMILNAIIFIAVLGLILYGIYYFFLLTPSQREYKRALRKSKRKNPDRYKRQ
jgi:amino acid transporter